MRLEDQIHIEATGKRRPGPDGVEQGYVAKLLCMSEFFVPNELVGGSTFARVAAQAKREILYLLRQDLRPLIIAANKAAAVRDWDSTLTNLYQLERRMFGD